MNRQLLPLPLAGFLVVLCLGLFVVWVQHNHWQLQSRKQLEDFAGAHATLLERRLTRSFSAAQTIGAVIRTQGEILDFDALAAELIASLGVISSLQLAPDGVIRKIYPLAGNQAALGLDVVNADTRKSDAFVALTARQLTVAGPFELVQGGTALVGRHPIFLTRDSDAEEHFWGFASAVVYMDELMAAHELSSLFDGNRAFQLWRYHPNTGERDVLSGEPDPHANPVTVPVSAYNLDWRLSVWYPQAPFDPFLPVQVVLILLAAGLTAYLLYFLVRQPLLLNQLVAEKTRLLEIANLQLRENERHLLRQAHHDPLTGLPNRLLFNDRLQRAIARAEREGNQFAVVLIDLKDFKPVNDRWGHAAGDQVLVQVGRRLQSCARRSDTVARVGGDEFVMLLTVIADGANAKAVANKVLDNLERPYTIPQGRVTIDCSLGVAVFPGDGMNADELLSRAGRHRQSQADGSPLVEAGRD